MTPISIVVTHRVLDDDIMHLSSNCAARIYANTSNKFELIFVDNASELRYLNPLLGYCHTYIRNQENLGNAKAWDQGVSVASHEYVVLMDNDVWVEPGWDLEMIDELANLDIGMTFPYSIVGDELNKKDAGFTVDYRGRRDGFCFAMKKQVYRSVGPFLADQPFKLGYYEDDWFEYRVQYNLRMKLKACPGSRVWHKGQGTTKKMWSKELEEGIEANKAWYEKKTKGIYPSLMEH